VTGVILAGGRSRRMGVADKGLIEIAGKPMLQYVIDRFGPQVGRLIINANGDPGRFARFGLPVVADTIGGFAGPLAGILAAMRWAEAHAPGSRFLATASADAPFLPADLVARFSAAVAGREGTIALAASGGNVYQVIGLWPLALADDLEDQLAAGLRKVLHWTGRHDSITVEFPPVEIGGRTVDPFFNANTPEDLDEVRSLLGR
jgi:molybdopterin-guanine dinucleotide biosynthesis protein A